jgi:hypothetical protein
MQATAASKAAEEALHTLVAQRTSELDAKMHALGAAAVRAPRLSLSQEAERPQPVSADDTSSVHYGGISHQFALTAPFCFLHSHTGR